MKRLITLCLLILSASLVACGGSAEPLTGEDINEEEHVAKLLNAGDLPTGWAASREPEFVSRTVPSGTYENYCTTIPSRYIASADVNFNKGAFGPFLYQDIIVYPDVENAEAALNEIIAAVENCPESVDDEGGITKYNTLSFPKFGDQMLALRTAWDSGQSESVRIRIGNAMIVIAHTGLLGVDTEQTEALVRAAVEKYERSR